MNATNPIDSAAPTPVPQGAGAKAFLVTSLVFLVLGMLMLAGRPGFLLSTTLTGHGLTWIELVLLGFALPAAFGASYLAVPRAFRIPLFSEKFVFLHLAFQVAGTVLVLAGAIFPGLQQAAMGPTFLASGAVVFAVNIGCSFRALKVPDPGAAFVVTGSLWLVISTLLGVPFAKTPPLAIFPPDAGWSAAWLMLMTAGVAGNIALGLAVRVGMTSLGVTGLHPSPAWYTLALGNTGLAWLFAALAFGPMTFVLFCAAVCLVAAVIFFAQYCALLQHRSTGALGWDARMLFSAFCLLPVAVALLGFGAWERMNIPPPAPAAPGVPAVVEEAVAGPLPVDFLPVDGAAMLTLLLGVVVPALVGLTFQLIRLDPRRSAADSFQERLAGQILLASFFNYAVGVLMVIPGAWVGIEKIVGLGTLFLLVGAGGFLGNYFYASGRASEETPQGEPVPTPVA